jgi:hypothetical protein
MKSVKLHKKKPARYLLPAIVAFIIGLIGLRILTVSHAATLNYTATETWDAASCTILVNGESLLYYPVQTGDSLNVTINNQTPFILNVDYSTDVNHGGSGQPYNVNQGETQTLSFNNIATDINVVGSGGTDACGSSTNQSSLWIKPGTASISCTTVPEGKVWGWSITGSYNNILSGTIYSDGILVGRTDSGGSGSINQIYTAGSSPGTVYFYDGNDSSGRLLAQVICQPGASSASTSTPTTTNTNPTVKSPTANPSTTASNSANPATSNSSTNATTGNKNKAAITKPIQTTHTAAKITTIGSVIVVVLGGLGWLLIRLGIIKLHVSKKRKFLWF